MQHRKRDTLVLKGSSGLHPALYVERELTPHGYRIAISELTGPVITEELTDDADTSRVLFAAACRLALDSILGDTK